jgi:hypothetical protein
MALSVNELRKASSSASCALRRRAAAARRFASTFTILRQVSAMTRRRAAPQTWLGVLLMKSARATPVSLDQDREPIPVCILVVHL